MLTEFLLRINTAYDALLGVFCCSELLISERNVASFRAKVHRDSSTHTATTHRWTARHLLLYCHVERVTSQAVMRLLGLDVTHSTSWERFWVEAGVVQSGRETVILIFFHSSIPMRKTQSWADFINESYAVKKKVQKRSCWVRKVRYWLKAYEKFGDAATFTVWLMSKSAFSYLSVTYSCWYASFPCVEGTADWSKFTFPLNQQCITHQEHPHKEKASSVLPYGVRSEYISYTSYSPEDSFLKQAFPLIYLSAISWHLLMVNICKQHMFSILTLKHLRANMLSVWIFYRKKLSLQAVLQKSISIWELYFASIRDINTTLR